MKSPRIFNWLENLLQNTPRSDPISTSGARNWTSRSSWRINFHPWKPTLERDKDISIAMWKLGTINNKSARQLKIPPVGGTLFVGNQNQSFLGRTRRRRDQKCFIREEVSTQRNARYLFSATQEIRRKQKNLQTPTRWHSALLFKNLLLPTPRVRNDYDEEAAYESYMNPEPGFQSGPGDSANAD